MTQQSIRTPRRILLCALVLMIGWDSQAVDPEHGVYDLLWKQDYLARFIPLLKHLSMIKGETGPQVMFISRIETFKSGGRIVWIYWPKMDHLIMYNSDTYNLELSRYYYDLKHGVGIISSDKEVGGSDWIITRKDAMKYVQKCMQGDKVVVK